MLIKLKKKYILFRRIVSTNYIYLQIFSPETITQKDREVGLVWLINNIKMLI